MNIGSISEDKKLEKRISITPDIVKKYINLGINVKLPKSYGIHLGFDDNKFTEEGAEIVIDDAEVVKKAVEF